MHCIYIYIYIFIDIILGKSKSSVFSRKQIYDFFYVRKIFYFLMCMLEYNTIFWNHGASLAYIFSCLIEGNDHLQRHIFTSEKSRILIQTLILLKPLNGMHFNVLDIMPGRQSLLSSQYVSHKSNSASNAFGHGKSSLKRSANKVNFSFNFYKLMTPFLMG